MKSIGSALLAVVAIVAVAGKSGAADFPAYKFPVAAAGGHIVHSKIIPGASLATGARMDFFVSKLFVMNPDGSGAQPFLSTPDLTEFKEARWSPSYDRLVFTSDFQNSRSACMEDLFELRGNGLVRRVTGQDVVGRAPSGYGAVRGSVAPVTLDGSVAPRYGSEISVTAQGADGVIFHPDLHGNEFFIPQVAAGEDVWIKAWASSQAGSLKLARVAAGETTDIGQIKLSDGVFTAGKGSLTADGRFLVGMGGISQMDLAPSPLDSSIGQTAEAFQPGLHVTKGGAESICVYDCTTGALLGSVDKGKMAYENAGDPALSPDGKWIACAWGRASQENLTLLSVESVLAGSPAPRVLVPGQFLVFQAGAPMIGCGTPAWSPDGRWIAFTRTIVVSGGVCGGGIWIVGSDGFGLREIASMGLGRVCCQPCFSPDGKKVAFTTLTGKFGPLKVEHLIGRQFSLDLFTADLQTGKIDQITRDGASCEAAWGP